MSHTPNPAMRAIRRSLRSSRTTVRRNRSGKAGERTFDILHDRQRDGERFASILPRHRNGRLAGDRLDKRLELESQRFAFRRIDGDALDERLERLRALCVTYERAKVDVLSQSVALD